MFLPKTDRKILPRWRDFLTTASLGLLSRAPAKDSVGIRVAAKSLEAYQSWQSHKTLWHALDLVGSAYALGDTGDAEVQAAAKFIEANGEQAPQPALELVSTILYPRQILPLAVSVPTASLTSLRQEIHEKRQRLAGEPRNSILLTDLSRLYTNVGQMEKAYHALQRALRLSPENRFIVSAVARFLVHIGDHSEALKILRAGPLIYSDPWVAAAEIGIATFAGTTPRHAKTGRKMLEDENLSDFSKTELASAMATLDLKEGNTRSAKKLFKLSLARPTENSVAQAVWASTEAGAINVEAAAAHVPLNFEAGVLKDFWLGAWESALSSGRHWLADQPFSSRPAGVVSYILSSMLERYSEAEDVLRASLISNPDDRGLVNNLAFALVGQGKLEEAGRLLATIDPEARDDLPTVTLLATKGLLHFRTGRVAAGRELYLQAISLAKRRSNLHYAALASIHLAMEEIRQNTEFQERSIGSASGLAAKAHEPDVKQLQSRMNKMRLEVHGD